MTGRWGEADERGAANWIDAAATLRGISAVRTGEVIPLALPIVGGDRGLAMEPRAAPAHYMTRHGGDYAAGLAERGGFGYSDDVVQLPTHGTTHIDALAHVWRDGRMYNGFSSNEVTSLGAAKGGIDKVGALATRAILADCRGESDRAIHQDELRDIVARTGATPEPGDALLVRTGWLEAQRGGCSGKGCAGLHHDCASWLVECGFALVAADNQAVEVLPSRDRDCAAPLHIALTRDNGIYLAELFDLEALAQSGRTEMLLVIAPLRIVGGVGSPITPVAVI